MHRSVFVLALSVVLPGCAGVLGFERTTPGMSRWAHGAMRQRYEDAFSCPAAQAEYRYVGPVRGTHWHRHEISGCDDRRRYWTSCQQNQCVLVTEAVEERAALEFECDVDAIEIVGNGNAVRARGCGSSGIYVFTEAAGFVLNAVEEEAPDNAQAQAR